MSKRTIRMSLNPASITQAIRQLRDEQTRIRNASCSMLRYLAEYGTEYARSLYGAGVDVICEQTSVGMYRIVANGDAAIALEFGEGVTTNQVIGQSGVTPLTEEEEDDDYIAETFTEMQMVMYRTAKAIRAEIPNAARMFFK